MTKKIFTLVLLFAFVSLACGLSSPATPDLESIVASTLTAIASNSAQSVSPTQTSGVAVSELGVQFIIPDGLASGATSEIIPLANEETNSDPWSMAPEHILFTLNGYSAPPDAFDAVIRIYPAKEYAALNPWAGESINNLQALLASPTITITNENAPTVPFIGSAAQQYAAQISLLSFNGGNGVRMISQYGQFPGHVIRSNSFYHYEGLTSDGNYLIAVLLPLTLPLESTAENPEADGIPYPAEDFSAMDAYYLGVTEKLNAASPDSFQPTLAQLDALVQSIQIAGP